MGLVIGIYIMWAISMFATAEFYLAMLPTIIGFIAVCVYILWIAYKAEHKDDNK